MSRTLAIARRELMAFLLSPVGYLVAALFLFFTSLVYFAAAPVLIGTGFSQGQPASLTLFFQVAVWVFFIIGPAISMRAISEELRLGTLETLLSSPITEAQIIVGKFLGALSFLALMLLPTLVYVIALERFGRPDYGELLCGYAGLLLVGSAYLASGILASTLTSSQVLAYITTIFFWLIVLLATRALPQLALVAEAFAGRPEVSPWLQAVLGWFQYAAHIIAVGDPADRMNDFVKGLIDSFSVVYFLVLTVVFLAAAVKSLALRRSL
jgi:ABC-2 type transport system permease protein